MSIVTKKLHKLNDDNDYRIEQGSATFFGQRAIFKIKFFMWAAYSNIT